MSPVQNVTYVSGRSTYLEMVAAPSAAAKFITQSRKAAKKRRRKLSFSFLCAFAPVREPHRHLPRSRHPELVCALHACGSRVYFSSLPFGLCGTMDAETSSA
jgi:hypothetical protein